MMVMMVKGRRDGKGDGRGNGKDGRRRRSVGGEREHRTHLDRDRRYSVVDDVYHPPLHRVWMAGDTPEVKMEHMDGDILPAAVAKTAKMLEDDTTMWNLAGWIWTWIDGMAGGGGVWIISMGMGISDGGRRA